MGSIKGALPFLLLFVGGMTGSSGLGWAQDHDEYDLDRVGTDMIAPSVRLLGDQTVGSGTIIGQEKIGNRKWRTTVLTAFHVVLNILVEKGSKALPFSLEVVSENGIVMETHVARAYFEDDMVGMFKGKKSRILEKSQKFDLALVTVESEEPFGAVAKLPTLASLKQIRARSKVHLVGFPLGIGPYHTTGEIEPFEEINGLNYRLLSAPSNLGNSGGGVFSDDTHELVGVLSKITMSNSGVTANMGMFIPMQEVYYWFYHVRLSRLVPSEKIP